MEPGSGGETDQEIGGVEIVAEVTGSDIVAAEERGKSRDGDLASLPQRGLFSVPRSPGGLIVGWGKRVGAAGQGKEDGICAWLVSSASVPLWFLGVEAGRGREMRGVSPGRAA